jgi:hypothetical protein
VRLIPAQYVKPFLKGHKNDFRDAEAIAEAVQRPTMQFVSIKLSGLSAGPWSGGAKLKERVLADVDPNRADSFRCLLRCAHRMLLCRAIKCVPEQASIPIKQRGMLLNRRPS